MTNRANLVGANFIIFVYCLIALSNTEEVLSFIGYTGDLWKYNDFSYVARVFLLSLPLYFGVKKNVSTLTLILFAILLLMNFATVLQDYEWIDRFDKEILLPKIVLIVYLLVNVGTNNFIENKIKHLFTKEE